MRNAKRGRIIVGLLTETGCKLSELLDARIGDVKNQFLILDDRKCMLSRILLRLLKVWMKGARKDQYIVSLSKNQLSARRVQQIVKEQTGKTPRILRKEYIQGLNRIANDILMYKTGLSSVRDRLYVKLDALRNLDFEDGRDEAIVYLLLETGCTVSELTNLQMKHLRHGFIEINNRQILLSTSLYRKILNLSTHENSYLISNDKKLSVRRVQQIVNRYTVRGHRLSPRIIRNSVAFWMHEHGYAAVEIEKQLGIKRVNLFTHGLMPK